MESQKENNPRLQQAILERADIPLSHDVAGNGVEVFGVPTMTQPMIRKSGTRPVFREYIKA